MGDIAVPMGQLEERITAWAQAEEKIRAAIVVGSRARTECPADEWSDLDLLLFTTDLDRYLSRADWLEAIGDVWISFLSRTAGGDPERVVMFAGGYNVDFVLLPADALRRVAEAETRPPIVRRGARLLVDKEGLAERALTRPDDHTPSRPPSPEGFAESVGMFWYCAHTIAKQICRGDLWMVKTREVNLREILLRAIETHAHVVGEKQDTWHMGRFLSEWADPRVLRTLPDLFASHDADDSWRALFAAMDLFGWIAREVAQRLGCPYPAELEARIAALIWELHARNCEPSSARVGGV